jgi:hypothetical protein
VCLVAVLLEETVKSLLLSDSKLSGLDARVVDTEQGVDVVHGLRADISKLLDLGGGILDLENKERTLVVRSKVG